LCFPDSITATYGAPLIVGYWGDSADCYINVETVKFNSSFTLTPSAIGLQFNPPYLTFSPNNGIKYFSMLASYVGSFEINWRISGPGAQYFTAPASQQVTAVKSMLKV
jgi:hypothetical protein